MKRTTTGLMERYRNVPMDLADVTLVALGQSIGVKRIFTLWTAFRRMRRDGLGRRGLEKSPAFP